MRGLLLAALTGTLGAGLGCGQAKEGAPAEAELPKAAPTLDRPTFTVPPPQQPFHFDHRIHAGKYEIPCQSCHVYADQSTLAGIPTLDKCMGCHRFIDKDKPDVQALAKAVENGTPVAWNRVHRLPDHVFFTHEPHVRFGVKCSTCHGDVAKMEIVHQVAPLTMGWCLQCHHENHVKTTDCLMCHK